MSLINRILRYLLFKINPAWAIIILLLISAFWFTYLPSLKFNYNIEKFFSSQDSEVEFYNEHKEIFENENDYLLVGIYNASGIFQHSFLQRIQLLDSTLRANEHIVKIYSPTNISIYAKGILTVLKIPLIPVGDSMKYAADKKRIYCY